MNRFLIWLGIKKPAEKKKKKCRRPSRIAVHLTDGRTIVHYAKFRTHRSDGSLILHDKDDGGDLIAHYTPNTWHSITTGTRKVSRGDQR